MVQTGLLFKDLSNCVGISSLKGSGTTEVFSAQSLSIPVPDFGIDSDSWEQVTGVDITLTAKANEVVLVCLNAIVSQDALSCEAYLGIQVDSGTVIPAWYWSRQLSAAVSYQPANFSIAVGPLSAGSRVIKLMATKKSAAANSTIYAAAGDLVGKFQVIRIG